jgi:hypothetical protein
MKKIASYLFLAALLIFAGGCKGKPDDQQAIRAALQQYLASRGNLNLAGMDLDIKQVTNTDANHAEALVEFRAKGAPPESGGMQVTYQFERQGSGWVVRSSRPSGGAMSHPPMDAPGTPPQGVGTLPAGHPPVGSTSPPPKKQ